MKKSKRSMGYRSHAVALTIVLSPVLLQIQECPRPDQFRVLRFEVAGQDLMSHFEIEKYEGYGVRTSSPTATLTVTPRRDDSTATYQWVIGEETTEAQSIGEQGGGTVTLDVPLGQSQLLVVVRTAELVQTIYTIDVNRVNTNANCVANSTGDPHLVTFDRYPYDLQSVGEFILTNSPSGGFEIQARTKAWGSSGRLSVNSAIAADVGGDIVSVYANDSAIFGDSAVYINGARVVLAEREKVDLLQGGSVERFRARTEVVWPTGEVAQITRRNGRLGAYYDVQVIVPKAQGASLEGLFGPCDGLYANDLWPRDAAEPLALPPSFNTLYDVFGDSWRLLPGESLFKDTVPDDPAFPDGPFTSADLPTASRLAAEALCLDQDIDDPILLENCIIDCGIDDCALVDPPDTSIIETYRSMIPTVGTPGPGELACGLLLSGSIDAPGEVDILTFTGNAGDEILLTTAQTSGFGGHGDDLEVTVVSPTSIQVDQYRGGGHRLITLPETGTYSINLESVRLLTGTYNTGFECLDPLSADAVLIGPGDVMNGSLEAAADVDLFTFSGSSGDSVLLTTAQVAGFVYGDDLRVTLYSPSGAVLNVTNGGSSTEVALPETGTYVITARSWRYSLTGDYQLGLAQP